MRIAIARGRLVLITRDGAAVDVAKASKGRFSSSAAEVYDDWEAFLDWGQQASSADAGEPFDLDGAAPLDGPSPRPRQVFAVGLNYRPHAEEAGLAIPENPPTFTKFPSCITGPRTEVVLPPGGAVDWEVEVVAVIGRQADHVRAEDAWSYVAGMTVGQDLSERVLQTSGPAPQFSLAKSFHGFGPTGPCLVTPDESADPDNLAVECLLNGELVQKDRTSSLIFPIPELVARLSAVCTMYPGDLVFTGTPSGVGHARTPQRYLQAGDELISTVEGIGSMRQTFYDPRRQGSTSS